MKHLVFTAALLGGISLTSFAQSDPLMKKLEKATDQYNDGKTDKAEAAVEKLLEDHPDYGKAWDLLIKMRYKDYEKAQDLKFTITTTAKNDTGKTVAEDDSLSQSLATLLSGMSGKKRAKSKYDYTIRKALLYTPEAVSASILWRGLYIDPEVDSNVNRKALRYYNEGEKEYVNRNFRAAAAQYRRALEEQPDFYKANLYMGDAFYGSENYSDAITTFKACILRFPDLLEPRKFLVDAYSKMSLYDKALDEAIASMAIYPDYSMLIKLDNAAYLNNKTLDIKWTRRLVFPNRIKPKAQHPDLNSYDEKEVKPTAPWNFYTQAANTYKEHYDEYGIRRTGSEDGGERYLELQSWIEMLRQSTDESLAEARKMQQAGYLDCYVLVTCFHPDFYEQYRDFARANSDKIARYYRKFLKDRS